jgi:hypothetical protein
VSHPAVSRARAGLTALALVVATATSPALAGDEEQELLLRLAVPAEVMLDDVTAELQRSGDPHEVELVDDGTVAGDLPHDGIYTGRDRGPYTRLLPVRLMVTPANASPQLAFEGLVQTVDARQDSTSWRLVKEYGAWNAVPTAAAYPGRAADSAGALPTAAALLWGALVVGTVAWVVRGRSTRRDGDG